MSAKPKPKSDAFVKSERHTLNGIKLEPWTADRSIAAQSLGMIFPALGTEGWASVKRSGIYPGAVRDVALALWLCSLTPEQVLEAECAGEKEAKKRSTEWAGRQGIHDTNKQAFWDALGLFMEMQREVNDSVTVPEKSAGTEDDDSGNG
jgi:hypothetical protein